jgi:hypothetical protein
LVKKLKVIKQDDLKSALIRVKTIEEFHKYLHEQNLPPTPPPEPQAKPTN